MILKIERLIVDNLQCEVNLQQYGCPHSSHRSCFYNKYQMNKYTKNLIYYDIYIGVPNV